eukprot:CAMPEP_0202869298 /NCGR_PEP_ID=MMETSP1391-20130828/12378_1 /ASSEMBLY_ACC=CAM_ASM_000867 /TAXON_ID=1034604 /ORGANISM="Chlamydomonas leiostraca, Strain SAG 11-49" /LENGTH=451 /DNA_ID=CAMNT_0049549607 /DNA_START=83 /DNA_END=1436 /DNA_ORIENTATION=-
MKSQLTARQRKQELRQGLTAWAGASAKAPAVVLSWQWPVAFQASDASACELNPWGSHTSVPRTAKKLAKTAAKAASSAASTAVHPVRSTQSLLSTALSTAASITRRVTNLNASLAGAGALIAALVAAASVAAIVGVSAWSYYGSQTEHIKHIVRPLHFDYSSPVAVATASLLPPNATSLPLLAWLASWAPYPRRSQPLAQQAGGAKQQVVLADGQQVSVQVVLHIPPDHGDLFQLTGELLGPGDAVLSRTTRTHVPKPHSLLWRTARHLSLAPLYMAGVLADEQVVTVRLVDRYVERGSSPALSFRALLASRNSTAGVLPPPAVLQGAVHMHLKLGLLRTLLYYVRPNLAVTLLVGGAAAVTALGAGAAALALGFIALVLYHLGRDTRAPPPKSVPDTAYGRNMRHAIAGHRQRMLALEYVGDEFDSEDDHEEEGYESDREAGMSDGGYEG